MTNYSNGGGRAFPTLDLGGAVSAPIATPDRPVVGAAMGDVAAHLNSFGEELAGLQETSAKVEARDRATKDVAAGTVAAQDDRTLHGQVYNTIAKQGLGEQRRVAMQEAMGQAYANNPDNPKKLDEALLAVKLGMQKTPFADLDMQLDNDFALQRATYMTHAQAGFHQQMLQTEAGNYQSAFQTGSANLAQAAASAPLDAAGGARVSAGFAGFVASLAKYGPPTAFKVGDIEIPADPNRTGAISAEQINVHAQAALAEAKREWFLSAQLGLPDAAAKAKYADELRARYEKGDPIFAGLDGAHAEGVLDRLDSQAKAASVDERADQAEQARKAEQMIEALQWGDNIDAESLLDAAHKSGDPGLLAKAEFYIGAAPELKGVLKTVVARQLGLLPDGKGGFEGQPLDANGNPAGGPVMFGGAGAAGGGGAGGSGAAGGGGAGVLGRPIVAPPAGTNRIADQVRGVAKGLGASPTEAESLVKYGMVESSLDPFRDNGASKGLFQFHDDTWEGVGGGDIRSVADQTRNALRLYRQDKALLARELGRAPTEGELYLAHQQGAGGAIALLSAPTGASAVDVLTPIYEKKYGERARAVAEAAVVRNAGRSDVTAQDFAHRWTQRFDGAPQPGADPWAPPAGAKPGSPAFYAWASAKEGFTSDPIDFARQHQIANPPPLIPQNGFSNDPAQVGPWADALRKRYALGQTLHASFAVPARILTDAEVKSVQGQLAADPASVIVLARRAQIALGPNGAAQLLKEVGKDGDSSLAIHIGNLEIMGAGAIAASAADGLRMRADGAEFPKWQQSETTIEMQANQYGAAFKYAPSVLVAAQRTAELARLADFKRGIHHEADWYMQSALGGVGVGGRLFGGVRSYNGVPTVVPTWLRQDSMGDAIKAIGDSYKRQGGVGAIYANGEAIPGGALAKYRPVMRPNGRYWLENPDTGNLARKRDGKPLELDFDANRAFLAGALPGSVRR